jgi:hypothetical protein
VQARPLAIAAIAALTLISAACSDDNEATSASSSTSASLVATSAPSDAGELEAFCAAGGDINSATATIDSTEAATTIFTDLQPTIEKMVAAAPTDLADEAQAFADHVDGALSSGDFTAFEDGTVDALVADLEAACSGADQ